MIIKYPLTDHFTNFYIGPSTQRVSRGPVRPLYYGVVSKYDRINILLMAGRFMRYILTIIIIIGSTSCPQKLSPNLIHHNPSYHKFEFSSEITNNSNNCAAEYDQHIHPDTVIHCKTQETMQDNNGNEGNRFNWLDHSQFQQNDSRDEDSDEDGDMVMYQPITITSTNMRTWLNNINNSLNTNNYTTERSEEPPNSSNNNIFTIYVDDIEMVIRDELRQQRGVAGIIQGDGESPSAVLLLFRRITPNHLSLRHLRNFSSGNINSTPPHVPQESNMVRYQQVTERFAEDVTQVRQNEVRVVTYNMSGVIVDSVISNDITRITEDHHILQMFERIIGIRVWRDNTHHHERTIMSIIDGEFHDGPVTARQKEQRSVRRIKEVCEEILANPSQTNKRLLELLITRAARKRRNNKCRDRSSLDHFGLPPPPPPSSFSSNTNIQSLRCEHPMAAMESLHPHQVVGLIPQDHLKVLSNQHTTLHSMPEVAPRQVQKDPQEEELPLRPVEDDYYPKSLQLKKNPQNKKTQVRLDHKRDKDQTQLNHDRLGVSQMKSQEAHSQSDHPYDAARGIHGMSQLHSYVPFDHNIPTNTNIHDTPNDEESSGDSVPSRHHSTYSLAKDFQNLRLRFPSIPWLIRFLYAAVSYLNLHQSTGYQYAPTTHLSPLNDTDNTAVVYSMTPVQDERWLDEIPHPPPSSSFDLTPIENVLINQQCHTLIHHQHQEFRSPRKTIAIYSTQSSHYYNGNTSSASQVVTMTLHLGIPSHVPPSCLCRVLEQTTTEHTTLHNISIISEESVELVEKRYPKIIALIIAQQGLRQIFSGIMAIDAADLIISDHKSSFSRLRCYYKQPLNNNYTDNQTALIYQQLNYTMAKVKKKKSKKSGNKSKPKMPKSKQDRHPNNSKDTVTTAKSTMPEEEGTKQNNDTSTEMLILSPPRSQKAKRSTDAITESPQRRLSSLRNKGLNLSSLQKAATKSSTDQEADQRGKPKVREFNADDDDFDVGSTEGLLSDEKEVRVNDESSPKNLADDDHSVESLALTSLSMSPVHTPQRPGKQSSVRDPEWSPMVETSSPNDKDVKVEPQSEGEEGAKDFVSNKKERHAEAARRAEAKMDEESSSDSSEEDSSSSESSSSSILGVQTVYSGSSSIQKNSGSVHSPISMFRTVVSKHSKKQGKPPKADEKEAPIKEAVIDKVSLEQQKHIDSIAEKKRVSEELERAEVENELLDKKLKEAESSKSGQDSMQVENVEKITAFGTVLYRDDMKVINPSSGDNWYSDSTITAQVRSGFVTTPPHDGHTTDFLTPAELQHFVVNIMPSADGRLKGNTLRLFELARSVGIPAANRSKEEFRNTPINYCLLMTISDAMAVNRPPSGGRHWIPAWIMAHKLEGSLKVDISYYHADSSHGNGILANQVGRKMHRLLSSCWPNGVLPSTTTMDVGAVDAPKQVDGFSCGPFTAEVLRRVSMCPLQALPNMNLFRETIANVTPELMPVIRESFDFNIKEEARVKGNSNLVPNWSIPRIQRMNTPQHYAGSFGDDLEEARRQFEAAEEEVYENLHQQHDEDDEEVQDPAPTMQQTVPMNIERKAVYINLNIGASSTIPPVLNAGTGMKIFLQLSQKIDQTTSFLPLYSNTNDPPISSSDETPTTYIDLMKYSHVQQKQTLVLQTGRDEKTGKKREQKNIFATFLVQSTVDTGFLCESITPDGMNETPSISARVKRLQEVDVVSHYAIIGIHHTIHPKGLEDVLREILTKQERIMQKNGLHKGYIGIAFPSFVIVIRPLNTPAGGDSSLKVNLNSSSYYLRNASYIETAASNANRVYTVFEKALDNRVLAREFGPYVNIIPVGIKIPKAVDALQVHLRLHRQQLSFNAFMASAVINGIITLIVPFKVSRKDKDESKGHGGTMTIGRVIKSFKAWDSDKCQSECQVVTQVVQNLSIPNSVTVVYFDDDRTRRVNGKTRNDDGPRTRLMNNFQSHSVAFLYFWMMEVLNYTEDTWRSARASLDPLLANSVELYSWNPITRTVSSSAAQGSGHKSYLERANDEWNELGMGNDDGVIQFDFGQFVDDKKKVDATNEIATREKAIEDERLYPNILPDRQVGASGATVRDDASGASSVAASARSTADINIVDSYRQNKLSLAQQKAATATANAEAGRMRQMLIDAGINPDVIDRAQNESGDEPQGNSNSRARFGQSKATESNGGVQFNTPGSQPGSPPSGGGQAEA